MMRDTLEIHVFARTSPKNPNCGGFDALARSSASVGPSMAPLLGSTCKNVVSVE
jgi:hypothetical protein